VIECRRQRQTPRVLLLENCRDLRHHVRHQEGHDSRATPTNHYDSDRSNAPRRKTLVTNCISGARFAVNSARRPENGLQAGAWFGPREHHSRL